MSAPWLLISKSASFDSRFGIAFSFHIEGFGSEGLNKDGMSFDANAGALRNRPVFVGAFIDAFHEATFGFRACLQINVSSSFWIIFASQISSKEPKNRPKFILKTRS